MLQRVIFCSKNYLTPVPTYQILHTCANLGFWQTADCPSLNFRIRFRSSVALKLDFDFVGSLDAPSRVSWITVVCVRP
jgi:hypothetical protein